MKTMFWLLLWIAISLFTFSRSIPSQCNCDERDCAVVRCNNANITDAILKSIAPHLSASIKILEISGNHFKEFPTQYFEHMKKLRKLLLSNNDLQRIPQNLTTFPVLQYLDLMSNSIKEIHCNDLKGLKKLRTLYLNNNHINNIENGSFSESSKLQKLSISNNNIINLPTGSFKGLITLLKLDMSRNKISFLEPGVFDHFKKFRIKLDFSQNRIQKIPNNLFNKFNKLYELNLSNNMINEIEDEAFVGVDFYRSILMVNNSIETLPPTAFKDMEYGMFFIDKNPINCSCEFYNTFQNIITEKLTFMGTCGYPKRIQDTEIKMLLLNTSTHESCPICERNNITCQNKGDCISVNRTMYVCNCTENYFGDKCEFKRIAFVQSTAAINVTNSTQATTNSTQATTNSTNNTDDTIATVKSESNLDEDIRDFWVALLGLIIFVLVSILILVRFVERNRRDKYKEQGIYIDRREGGVLIQNVDTTFNHRL